MRNRKWKYLLAAIFAPIAWLIFFSIDYNYDKKTDLGGGMTLISTIHVDRSPFQTMADSGGSALIGFTPYSHSEMVRQKLMRGHTRCLGDERGNPGPENLLRRGES